MTEEKKIDSRELQWMKLEAKNLELSTEKGDMYDRRADSCTNLLSMFC